MFGVSPSQETREKISRSLYGRFRGEESPHYGKSLSQEAKDRISEKAKERLKDKTCHPMYGVCRKGEDNPFLGRDTQKKHERKLVKVERASMLERTARCLERAFLKKQKKKYPVPKKEKEEKI